MGYKLFKNQNTKIKASHLFIACVCALLAVFCVAITAAKNAEYLSTVIDIPNQEQDNNEEADEDETEESLEQEPAPVVQTTVDKLTIMSSEAAKLAAKNIKPLGLTSKNLSVPLLYQNPTLPSGCEAVALTNQLKYYGFSLGLTTIVDNYMPYSTSDWVNAYVGSPYEYYGVTIMAPGITTTANNFLKDNQAGFTNTTNSSSSTNQSSASNSSTNELSSNAGTPKTTDDKNSTYFYAYDVSGQNFEELFKYVERGHPVQIWITHRMQDPGYVNASIDDYKFCELEHCILLTGFDRTAHTITVTDSIYGISEYSITSAEYVYNWLNKQAVVILSDKEVNAFIEGKDASYDGSVEATQVAEVAAKAALFADVNSEESEDTN